MDNARDGLARRDHGPAPGDRVAGDGHPRRHAYADPATVAHPDLVLLDLNIPKKDSREALAEIKADPRLRHIPIVVLTTSSADGDVVRAYDLGVNSFIAKPVTFEGLVDVLQTVTRYWFQIVRLLGDTAPTRPEAPDVS